MASLMLFPIRVAGVGVDSNVLCAYLRQNRNEVRELTLPSLMQKTFPESFWHCLPPLTKLSISGIGGEARSLPVSLKELDISQSSTWSSLPALPNLEKLNIKNTPITLSLLKARQPTIWGHLTDLSVTCNQLSQNAGFPPNLVSIEITCTIPQAEGLDPKDLRLDYLPKNLQAITLVGPGLDLVSVPSKLNRLTIEDNPTIVALPSAIQHRELTYLWLHGNRNLRVEIEKLPSSFLQELGVDLSILRSFDLSSLGALTRLELDGDELPEKFKWPSRRLTSLSISLAALPDRLPEVDELAIRAPEEANEGGIFSLSSFTSLELSSYCPSDGTIFKAWLRRLRELKIKQNFEPCESFGRIISDRTFFGEITQKMTNLHLQNVPEKFFMTVKKSMTELVLRGSRNVVGLSGDLSGLETLDISGTSIDPTSLRLPDSLLRLVVSGNQLSRLGNFPSRSKVERALIISEDFSTASKKKHIRVKRVSKVHARKSKLRAAGGSRMAGGPIQKAGRRRRSSLS